MRAEVLTVIWILASVFLTGGWFGWYLGRRFEQQRRIANVLRARLLWYRLYNGIAQVRARQRAGEAS